MGRDVRLTWTLTPAGAGQAEIAQTRIDGRLVADPELEWTDLGTVDAPEAEIPLQDVALGKWEYRAVALDEHGREAAEKPTIVLDVLLDLPPGVSEFTGELV